MWWGSVLLIAVAEWEKEKICCSVWFVQKEPITEMSIFCLDAAWFPAGLCRLLLWAFWVSAGLQDSGLFGVTVWHPGLRQDWRTELWSGRKESSLMEHLREFS